MKEPHPRAANDFRVTSLAWEIDIEKRYMEAGFDLVAREIIVRRYFQFLNFLQKHGMTTRTVCARIEDVDDKSEWKNSDLTDEGFVFTQRFHGRWLNRTRKDRGEEKEEPFLRKWLADFQSKERANQALQATAATPRS
jgi:hypothetical protein